MRAWGGRWAPVAQLLHCLCRHAQTNTRRLEGGRWAPQGRVMSDTVGQEGCLQDAAAGQGSLVQVSTQGRQALFSPQPSLDRRAQENPGPVEQRSKRHSKQRKQARCREQRSPGVRGHCFCRRHSRQRMFILGEGWLTQAPVWSPGSSSQALTTRSGAGSIIGVQGTEPKVTVFWNAPLCPQHPGVGSNLVQ